MARRKKVNLDKPYSLVYGVGKAVYEQDGRLFDSRGLLIGESADDSEKDDDQDSGNSGSQVQTQLNGD